MNDKLSGSLAVCTARKEGRVSGKNLYLQCISHSKHSSIIKCICLIKNCFTDLQLFFVRTKVFYNKLLVFDIREV
jgi:hypothetical protein